MLEGLLTSIIIVLPAMVANSTALILGGSGPLISERYFGKNKTIRGYISAVFGAMLTSLFLYELTRHGILALPLNGPAVYIIIGFLQGNGAMFGDLLGSYIKRRNKILEGEELKIIDQIGFIVFAIIFTIPIYVFEMLDIVIILLLTYGLHKTTNLLAYNLHMKDRKN